MALPKLQTPEYKLLLPSTQEEIKYRPFLVKEQKILMIAQESGDERQIADAMGTLVSNCSFGAIDINKSPMFDIEYVFLQLRAKSAGGKVKLNITCPDDEETKVEVEINLEEIAVQHSVEHSQEITITEDIKLKLRYPMLRDIQNISSDVGEFEKALLMVHGCIESVIYGEETIYRIDMTNDEISEFIDSFNTEQMENILKFFETMPKVRHIIDVVNPKTKKKGEVLLEGLASFLR
jgi:hypothetical protein